jgi:hypothetical protein
MTRQVGIFPRACWPTGSYPETGLGEINGDVPEADFWPVSPNSRSGPITSELPVIRPRVHSSCKAPTQSYNPTIGVFKRKLSTLNSRQALISEQDARSVNQILFIAKLFNQFVGKQRDFALQIRGQLAIDFSARVRR